MRTFFIWATGILASAIICGGIGDYLQPYGAGGFWGILFGPLAFTCVRLWLAEKRKPPAPSRADTMCQAMILAAKNLGAKSPREAAEISRGSTFTDVEWQQHRVPWEQNWSA
jgi:hypothetical protein